MPESREQWLAETFVELSDTLVADFDLIDFLYVLVERCSQLLSVEVGLVLADEQGTLQNLASSTERMHVVELFEIQSEDGPCLECYGSGQQILNERLNAGAARWPRFTPSALEAGFTIVHALPLHLRNERIGAMNLFGAQTVPLEPHEVHLAQALADVATIGILQERSVRHLSDLSTQLQAALQSRIAIEQAKGVLAERQRASMDEAFALLRGYARSHNLRLAHVAASVIDGTVSAKQLREARPAAAQGARRSP
jgi:transcriptional regulator with GAF, ATPase, and Fis domain